MVTDEVVGFAVVTLSDGLFSADAALVRGVSSFLHEHSTVAVPSIIVTDKRSAKIFFIVVLTLSFDLAAVGFCMLLYTKRRIKSIYICIF